MNNKKVAIILLNYNGYEDTIECFKSLRKISYVNYEIIIVDNASPDQSMARIVDYMENNEIKADYFEDFETAMMNGTNKFKVHLIQSSDNYGYGHGNNIGIKYALQIDADYVLILNNDTIVKENFLEPMVEMCENDNNIGIVSGKIYYYDRPDTLWFNGGAFNPFTGKIKHFNFNEKDVGNEPNKEITFITGCMWLIPKKIFTNVGFINEEYFMYVEDTEFTQRVLKFGYKLAIAKKSHILHKVGSSSGGGDFTDFSAYFLAKNKLKFIFSNLNLINKISAISVVFFEPIRLMKNRQKFSIILAYIRGIIDYFIQKDEYKWK